MNLRVRDSPFEARGISCSVSAINGRMCPLDIIYNLEVMEHIHNYAMLVLGVMHSQVMLLKNIQEYRKHGIILLHIHIWICRYACVYWLLKSWSA